MPDFASMQQTARDEWKELENSTIPVIYFGMASCGRAAGAVEVRKAVEEALDENFLTARLVDVGCIGPCYMEPIMDITLPGWARVSYGQMTPAKAKRIVIEAIKNNAPPLDEAAGILEPLENRQTGGLPRFLTSPC
jgi:(2Fe-2S) ferredoxin